ncbi:nucleotidyltransferase domain-containing protein [Deltaproteobacteria bacterium Smac51]|nr:nucleotidyltransferase domain-containing protein [Deltaproteobacteria bacterium Smac51]
MIEPQKWVSEALSGLRAVFGARLIYLGLQGSYRRGEATESSDIDLVTLLDQVSLDDLDAYRGVVRALPEGDKACGFICGADEFAHWPRHELFPFKMDTADYHGQLETYLPPISHHDICEGARIGASSLTHFLTHSYLYAAPEDRASILKEAYKAAFFVMQVVNYLKTGAYHTSKKELLPALAGAEHEIIQAGLDFPVWLTAHSEKRAFEMLLAWCREVLTCKFY